MASETSVSVTITETEQVKQAKQDSLILKKKSKKQVKWSDNTVDNEHMNKKKSKSCCIYYKSKKFDESDSASDNDNEDDINSYEKCQSGTNK